MMKSFLRKIYTSFYNEQFAPTFFSIFFNPFFIIRSGIFSNLKSFAPRLKGRLLDFGCGTKPYESIFKVDQYIGVDYESIEASKNPKIDVFYNGKTLPFDDNHFDSILCTEVIEHVFNPEEILPELHRVLRPGGIALFTFPFSWPEHAQPYDYARYTSFSSKYLFEKHNFIVLEIKKSGDYLRALVQLFLFYIFTIIPIKSTIVKVIVMLPFTLFIILPKNKDLYLNNIVLVSK
jgi:SAM-dependent methyltransferase